MAALRKQRCKHGHPMDDTDFTTRIGWDGFRRCRLCRNRIQREHMARKRSGKVNPSKG